MKNRKSGLRGQPPTILDRRRFMRALGLGGLAALALGNRSFSRAAAPPVRLVLWMTGHGTVWNHWNMTPSGLGSGPSSASLVGLADAGWSHILRPLRPHAGRIQVVEGLGRSVQIDYIRRGAQMSAPDLNAHHVGQAMVLTCVDPVQKAGSLCASGGRSIDQVIGAATATPGRWASRVYGNLHQGGRFYSFTGNGTAAPLVQDPRAAFDDILGLYTPPEPQAAPSRASRVRAAQASALDFAAHEFELAAPKLGAQERRKLEQHRDLIRDLERSFVPASGGYVGSCEPGSYATAGDRIVQFGRVMALALACDMTRVITYSAPVLSGAEFGAPAGIDVHQDVAHVSIAGEDNFRAEAERYMADYNRVYAQRFAAFLDELAAIPEGGGTLLDNTMVAWITELATGPHHEYDIPVVLAGGGGGFLAPGRYVRYPRDKTIQAAWGFKAACGPSQSRLYVTLMRGMGMKDEAFGIESVPVIGGGTLSSKGVLPELLA